MALGMALESVLVLGIVVVEELALAEELVVSLLEGAVELTDDSVAVMYSPGSRGWVSVPCVKYNKRTVDVHGTAVSSPPIHCEDCPVRIVVSVDVAAIGERRDGELTATRAFTDGG